MEKRGREERKPFRFDARTATARMYVLYKSCQMSSRAIDEGALLVRLSCLTISDSTVVESQTISETFTKKGFMLHHAEMTCQSDTFCTLLRIEHA